MTSPRAAIRAVLLAGACLMAASVPAAAHKLKVFATVEGATISGFAFFVGGGRPEGARVLFRDKDGHDLGAVVTDKEGAFSFTPGRAEDVAVVVDAGDGHSAETLVAADRLAPLAAPGPGAAAPVPAMPAIAPPAARPAPSLPVGGGPSAACDPERVAYLVDEAVARRIRPLLEAQAQAQDQVRFKDIVGGIGMIVGLAGAALWVSARAGTRMGAGARAAPPDA